MDSTVSFWGHFVQNKNSVLLADIRKLSYLCAQNECTMDETQIREELTAPIAAISRHRILLGGDGVRTLVIFQGCPLRCEFCVNLFAIDTKRPRKRYTAEQLVEKTMEDNLDFLATHGGITFGGGEPLLQSRFIARFHEVCPPEWTIQIETSLNVPQEDLARVEPFAQHFIVDVKDMNPAIYQRYTRCGNERVLANLRWLIEKGRADDIFVRVPLIPEYNTADEVEKSIADLQAMGLTHFDRLTYKIRNREQNGK